MDCAWLHSCMDNTWLKFVTTRGLEVSIHPPKYFQKLESLQIEANIELYFMLHIKS